jgi:hypothetical protein
LQRIIILSESFALFANGAVEGSAAVFFPVAVAFCLSMFPPATDDVWDEGCSLSHDAVVPAFLLPIKPGERDKDFPNPVDNKKAVVSMVQRNGDVRSHHVQRVTAKNLRPILNHNIEYTGRGLLRIAAPCFMVQFTPANTTK